MDTIGAYLLKDEYGDYVIPAVHQRPVLLLGAPGIGKTQIMEQIAAECGIGLVSYTITHHTRQSAIGLPVISRETFGGREYTMTGYTMSEIIASVYQKMEKTGLSEGILFIDEVNCVSETLAPAMLQFLQCKTFGTHEVPPGWIIVTAGNPPEYNRSVRDFDVVTMDRVKKIEVEPDLEVWKKYAWEVRVHPAVISYLNIRPRNFYRMETTVDGRFFATPRGWEDLSRLLQVYEKLSKKTDMEVVLQYIQHPEIARDFADYLELYDSYQADGLLDAVFEGRIEDLLLKRLAHATFDERLSVLGLLLARCGNAFSEYVRYEDYLSLLHGTLKGIKAQLLDGSGGPQDLTESVLSSMKAETEAKERAELLGREEKKIRRMAEAFWEKAVRDTKTGGSREGEAVFAALKESFSMEKDRYDQAYRTAAQTLEYAFDLLEAAFGTGQEIVLFLTELNANSRSLRFLSRYDCERYYRYNQTLLYEDRNRQLLKKIEAVTGD